MKFQFPSIDKYITEDNCVVESTPRSKKYVNILHLMMPHGAGLVARLTTRFTIGLISNKLAMRKLLPLLTILLLSITSLRGQIIDSNISLTKALEGTTAPNSITKELVIIDVEYFSTDSLLHRGQIVVNRKIEQEVIQIFEYIKSVKYPVKSVIPIKFDLPNGNTTMANLNNTYCFHYRTVAGSSSKLSRHSQGLAIDFNPFDNPYISKAGKVIPKGGIYDTSKPETLTKDCDVVKKFISLGWIWGGNWNNPKDYMHFERRF